MSFIFAEKFTCSELGTENMHVFCDTRIGLPDSAGSHLSDIELTFIKKYGIVKSTIISPELCVSFAGNNIMYASKLFKKLAERDTVNRTDVIDLAYSIHMQANSLNDIEFIISCMEDGKLHIDCIKGGYKDKDCLSAWIGSPIAFNYFQEKRLERNSNSYPLYMNSHSAFSETVAGCGDNTVGGLAIGIMYYYDCNSFQFMETHAFYSSKPQSVPPGGMYSFFLSATDGGFSYHISPYTTQVVLISIDQMKPAILYSSKIRRDQKDLSNPSLFLLMLPLLVVEDGNGGWICQ